MIFPIDLIYLNEIDSTNNFIKREFLLLNNWTVVVAENQTNGRGTKENIWISKKGENITFSLLIKPNINIQDFFLLNMFVCNAIHKVLLLYHSEIWIKWPNDIVLINKKICGILIENSIYKQKIIMSIIGIGLNVHENFLNKLPNASSLKELLGKDFNLKKILMNIIITIQNDFLILKNNKKFIIKNYYLKYLYKKNQISFFKIDGKICSGIIRNVKENGQLVVTLDKNLLRSFYHKEIYLYY